MIKKFNRFLVAIAGLALLALAPAAVKADATLVVMNPGNIVNVTQGSSGSLIANITNTGTTTLSLDQIDILISGPAGLTFDNTPFFAINPFVLGPGDSTGFVSFFDILADLTVPPGLYLGSSFSVQLGCSPSCTQPDLTADFSINVLAGQPSNIPEPATMLLLATGLGGAALAKRRAKRKEKTEAGI